MHSLCCMGDLFMSRSFSDAKIDLMSKEFVLELAAGALLCLLFLLLLELFTVIC
jgi:hypothetical protein